ncbi:uncharacterized protein BXZ73DRAFT_84126 [Epithele typhae]|uniref:uncharacterized protein n=1 Tax=Epithele typhae TaxID=378194 RepID=UPI0020087525|nr:uncharacterized protein BXZ73DRAFT_84126 [Epithele typhae]KAH9909431.1 hypothetical protein BXZ73DRAFT_84126 [Epithele typhae]
MVSVVEADLIAGFLECILFGIFFVLSTTSLALLLRRHREAHSKPATSSSVSSLSRWAAAMWSLRHSPLIVATGLLFATITAHCIVTARRLILAIAYHETRSEAEAFISDLGEITQVIRLVFLFIDMFIGDLVIAYRVWHVWGRQRGIIALPLLTTVALVATGIGLIHQFLLSEPGGTVFDPKINRWITAYTTMTFGTNIYGTVVIAYRIWSTNRMIVGSGLQQAGDNVQGALAIFVESAALYTAWGIFFVVVYSVKSNLQIIGTSCAPSVLGVTFMLITVRVGLGWEFERNGSMSTGSGSVGTIQWARRPLSQSEAQSGPMPLNTLSFAAAHTAMSTSNEGADSNSIRSRLEKRTDAGALDGTV